MPNVLRKLNESVDWLHFAFGAGVMMMAVFISEESLGTPYIGVSVVMLGILIHSMYGMAKGLAWMAHHE